MNTNEMFSLMRDVGKTIKSAEEAATLMANILDGRLRMINNHGILCRMKKELKKYNSVTGEWK